MGVTYRREVVGEVGSKAPVVAADRSTTRPLSVLEDLLLVPESSVSNHLWIALFCFLNVLGIRALVGFYVFGETPNALVTYGGVMISLLTIISVFSMMLLLFRGAWSDLLEGYFSEKVSVFFALAAGSVGFFAIVLRDISALSTQSLGTSLVTIVLLLALLDAASQLLATRLYSRLGGGVKGVVTEARRIAISDSGAPEVALERIPIAALAIGDLVRVGAGDVVPCDGRVIAGVAEIYERKLTGRGRPVLKGIGREVFAGSIVNSGSIDLKCEATPDEARISHFGDALNQQLERVLAIPPRVLTTFGLFNLLAVVAGFIGAIVASNRGAPIGEVSAIVCAVALVVTLSRTSKLIRILKAAALTKIYYLGAMFRAPESLEIVAGVKACVLEIDPENPPGRETVERFEMIDQRFERDTILSITLALVGSADEEGAESLYQGLRALLVSEPALFPVSDFNSYPGLGVSGTVQGAEFSIGSEEFLIERGVQIQPSELTEENAKVVLIGYNDEVIARFYLLRAGVVDARALRNQLRAKGQRMVLIGSGPAAELDRYGQEIGLDLGEIKSGLAEGSMVERLNDLPKHLLYTTRPAELKLPPHSIDVAPFDEVRWSTQQSAITLFTKDLRSLGEILALSSNFLSASAVLRYCSALLAAGLGALAFLGIIGPATLLWLAGCFILCGYLVVGYRLPLLTQAD